MAPAPIDNLSPAGSSSYSSNTLTVGDGTWDSSKNTFLLPNLQALNFETMQYNGMGNRFATMEQYHYLVRAHAVIAVIAFLFLLPASIMFARFYAKVPGRGVRMHIYLNILVLGLSTVAFILGFMAVGPSRNLTNPHHGIGVAIYVLIIVQVLGGNWMRKKLIKKRPRRPPIKMMLHQWIGRATAILGIIQVPLGLTLYGSPKWTFILYTLWMTFMLLLYFINSYKASGVIEDIGYKSGVVIDEKKKKKGGGGLGKVIAPIAAGAGMAWLASRLGGREEHHRDEVIPSRHGSRRNSGSYVEDEKYEERKSGGWMKKLLAGGAAVGAVALAKRWYDKRNARDDEYESVAPDTPNRRRPRVEELSDYSVSEIEVRRAEHERPPPAAIEATAAAAAISAAEGGGRRPRTPERLRTPRRHRRDSNDSYSSVASPSRREEKSHAGRNAVLGGIGLGGLGWLGKKFKDNKDRKEEERLDAIRRREEEDERRMEADRRRGGRPPRYTGDGHPSARAHGARRDDIESDLSSDVTNTPIRARPGGPMPPLSAGVLPGATAAAAAPSIIPSGSRHEIINPVPMPPGPPRDDYLGSESVGYDSAGGGNVRRQSSRGRREAEAAAATAGAALAAAEMESRHRRDQSQGYRSGDSRPAASVKMRVHDDPNRNVTLRRLTEEEAAAEREARRSSRRRRANSASSFSDADTAPSRRRYRRDALDAEMAAEKRAEAGAGGAGLEPLSPPRPAFAGGRQPKDSAYYSGPGAGGPSTAPSGIGSSPGSWTALSPGGESEDPAERRRRRRAERSQRGGGGTTVDFT